MPDYSSFTPWAPLFISSFSEHSSAMHGRALASGLAVASGPWPAADRAIYIPFRLRHSYPCARMYWRNGSAAGGNWDIGIYTADGTLLTSIGSTAGSGNSVPQYVTLPQMLSPGSYYFGVVLNAVTANRAIGSISPTVLILRRLGVLQQASAFPLPATMTPATVASAWLPWVGMTLTPSGF